MNKYQNIINAIGHITKYKFLTMDKDGAWYLHKERPKRDDKFFLSCDFVFLDFIPEDTTINWEEAIFEAQIINDSVESHYDTKAYKYIL